MLRSPLLIAVVAGTLLMSGCAATPYEQLVPSLGTDQPKHAGKSISVGPVTSSDQSSWGLTLPKVSAEVFREALVESLRRSQLLETAASAPEEAYRLSADIVAERMTGTVANTITLLIRYELERDGKLVWSDNILSLGELSAAEAFLGSERHSKLQIDAFQDNLAALLEKVAAAIGSR